MPPAAKTSIRLHYRVICELHSLFWPAGGDSPQRPKEVSPLNLLQVLLHVNVLLRQLILTRMINSNFDFHLCEFIFRFVDFHLFGALWKYSSVVHQIPSIEFSSCKQQKEKKTLLFMLKNNSTAHASCDKRKTETEPFAFLLSLNV